jgi:hypothetical protein
LRGISSQPKEKGAAQKMAKIVSLIRKTNGVPGVPALIIVGSPIAEAGAIVDKILYRKYESEYFYGGHFQVDFKDAPTKVIVPVAAVLEVMYETQPKKEKVEVPSLA